MPIRSTPSSVFDRIERFNAGRNSALLIRKYAAMRADPFVFFRGTAHLFWEDWPDGHALDAAPPVWSCGDLHLENFGSFRGDNGLVYFDLNDFDEAALAPATRDVARFLTSVHLAARSLSLGRQEANALCTTFIEAYTSVLRDGRARWVERATSEGMVRDLLRAVKRRRRRDLLDRKTIIANGRRWIQLDDEHAFALKPAERRGVSRCIQAFAESQRHRATEFYRVLDVAGRIAGTGSLGIRRYVALIRGRDDNANLLIDLKEARPSTLAPSVTVPQPAWRSEADRVTQVQRRMQAASPALLAAVALDGGHFVLRELQPSEDRVALARWNGKLTRLRKVMTVMGHVVASAQLRSTSRQGSSSTDALIEFAQRRGWKREIAHYAHAYAARARADWAEFAQSAPAAMRPQASRRA